MFYPLKLASRVDRAAQVHEDDTLQTKATLKALGHYKTPSYGMTPYPDEPMFDGIKAYQKANKLKIDGVMKPGGETEQSMNERVAEAQAAERERHGATARRKERRDALQRERRQKTSDEDSPFLDTLEKASREKLEDDAKKKYIDEVTKDSQRKDAVRRAKTSPKNARPFRGGSGGGMGINPKRYSPYGRGSYDPYEWLDM
ncbi:hypothetical protein L2D14_01485 [Thalassospiraceae bacterium LMO-JJ14]|nr:hypothetical protein L2D14_01485 [Thalassospiraceae bacterium LMO-JJ14]